MLQLALPVRREIECKTKKITWQITQYVCMQICVEFKLREGM